MMADFLASGRVLDWIVAGMALEGAGLSVLWRLRRRGLRPGDLLPNLCSGMALLLAMRIGLAGGWWGWICLALLAALAGHLTDLLGRWRSAP